MIPITAIAGKRAYLVVKMNCRGKQTARNRSGVKQMFSFRSAALATAFAVTVAAAVTGASLKGETREVRLDQACAHETWPAIPAQCLSGEVRPVVRIVAVDHAYERAMRARFAAAFE